jgi:hypothetical protein
MNSFSQNADSTSSDYRCHTNNSTNGGGYLEDTQAFNGISARTLAIEILANWMGMPECEEYDLPFRVEVKQGKKTKQWKILFFYPKDRKEPQLELKTGCYVITSERVEQILQENSASICQLLGVNLSES